MAAVLHKPQRSFLITNHTLALERAAGRQREGFPGVARAVHAVENVVVALAVEFRQRLAHGPALDGAGRKILLEAVANQLEDVLGAAVAGDDGRKVLQNVKQALALAVGFRAGRLLGVLARAQLSLGSAAGRNVLHGLDNEEHLPPGVEHGRVARLPVALDKPAELRRVRHVVVLGAMSCGWPVVSTCCSEARTLATPWASGVSGLSGKASKMNCPTRTSRSVRVAAR